MQQDLSLDTLIPVYIDALEAEDKSPRTIVAYRECLSFYMKLASTEGLPSRADEIAVADVYARVLHGKGKKQRVIAFGETVAAAIGHYLEVRGDPWGLLFQTRQGRRMKTQGLVVIFQRISATTGIPRVRAHRFRHTFATMAIRSAAREIDVQHLLGHTTWAMVRRYTRTYDAEQAALVHASFSPVAGLHLEPPPTSVPAHLGGAAPAPSRPAPAKPTRTVALQDRQLVPGMRLTASYKGVAYEAWVIEHEDRIGIQLGNGPTFASLSAAGRHVMGGVACNGWRFWSIAAAETSELTAISG